MIALHRIRTYTIISLLSTKKLADSQLQCGFLSITTVYTYPTPSTPHTINKTKKKETTHVPRTPQHTKLLSQLLPPPDPLDQKEALIDDPVHPVHDRLGRGLFEHGPPLLRGGSGGGGRLCYVFALGCGGGGGARALRGRWTGYGGTCARRLRLRWGARGPCHRDRRKATTRRSSGSRGSVERDRPGYSDGDVRPWGRRRAGRRFWFRLRRARGERRGCGSADLGRRRTGR